MEEKEKNTGGQPPEEQVEAGMKEEVKEPLQDEGSKTGLEEDVKSSTSSQQAESNEEAPTEAPKQSEEKSEHEAKLAFVPDSTPLDEQPTLIYKKTKETDLENKIEDSALEKQETPSEPELVENVEIDSDKKKDEEVGSSEQVETSEQGQEVNTEPVEDSDEKSAVTVAASETLPPDDRAFNTMEMKGLDQWSTEEKKEPETSVKQQTEQLEEAKDKNRPKKILVGVITASMLLIGAYCLSAYAFGEKTLPSGSVKAEQPKPKPAFMKLELDGQTYELDLTTIGYDGKNVKTIDDMKLRTWLDEVKKKVDQPAQNASMKKLGMKITPEKAGRKMDVKVVNAWLTDISSIINKPQQIPMIPVEPTIVAADLEQVDKKLIGSYTTSFDGGNVNRTTNIRLASKAINNLVLLPGEEFSFNRVVGQRTAARGYKSAKVIVKGEYSEGIGGGICQVSSTLFNSVDEAGLRTTRRQSHSKEVTYVPAGRDATVSWGGPDYRFKNNLDKPIVIKIHVAANSITVNVYTTPGAKKVAKKKVEQAPGLESFTTIPVADPEKPSEILPPQDNNN